MRRVHVPQLAAGLIDLAPHQSHHLRDVLRMKAGDPVQLFDDAGRSGQGTIVSADSPVRVAVEQVIEPRHAPFQWTIASALPKGNRADWMIEKLSELGTATFIPLAAERSVVLSEGAGKRQRWQRIAAEAARQSRRSNVMQIDPLTPVPELLRRKHDPPAWCFSTDPASVPIASAAAELLTPQHAPAALAAPAASIAPQSQPALHLTCLIGPEGGWTDRELALFHQSQLTSVSLGPTILRIETAAVAAAVVAAAILARR